MSHHKIRVVFFGTPEFAVPSLSRLLAEPGFEVLAVVTQPDKRRGRGNQVLPSPVKVVASTDNLPVWQPKSVKRDLETLTKLQELQADAFVVVAYGQILSQEILDMPRLGCINCHGSILPKYRGAAPIQWSLYHGEEETGVTTMLMDAGMDTGPILLKSYVAIELLDNAQAIATTLSLRGADLLSETLQKLDRQEIQPILQDSSQATYAPLIRKQDYQLDWSRSAMQLHNQVRGFSPNCMALFRGAPLKITATAPLGSAAWPLLPPDLQVLETDWPDTRLNSSSPGEIVEIVKPLGPIVQTGQGALLLRELQPAGKRLQSGWDFANGVRLTIGEFIENSQ
jgi:methionyl-tRNA formyltransferase